MRIKRKIITLLIVIAVIAALSSLTSSFYFNSTFSEKDAFMMVFGNYDPIHKNATWKNMRFPKNETVDEYFWKSRVGIASEIFFRSYIEHGVKKVLFITKTSPFATPYDCHACLPLLNATIFVKNKGKWNIENQNLFLMYEGEYAQSPIINLIQVGDEKYGATLEFEHRSGEFLDKELYILIPYNKDIVISHQETIYYDNFNGCGWSIQCATFAATLNFSKISNDVFYQLKIKRFGTMDDASQHYQAVPVKEESTYQLFNGKYVQASWKGYPKIKYE